MANSRELVAIFRAQDSMSPGVKQIDSNLERLEGQIRETSHAAESAGSGFGSLARQIGVVAAGAEVARLAHDALAGSLRMLGDTVIGTNASLETATLQFKTLMGSAELAENHVRSLFLLAKESPFETGPIIEASRMLEVFGGAALNTEANLRLIGDAAAAVGAPINDVATWVGRMYSAIAAGRPIGEAASELQRLAVLSPDARNALEQLASSGGSTADAWRIMTTELEGFSGAMAEQAGTWEGMASTFTDSVQMLLASAFKPFFDEAKNALAAANDFLDMSGDRWAADMSGAITDVITALGGVPTSADPVADFLESLPGMIRETIDPLRDLQQAIKDIKSALDGLAGWQDSGIVQMYREFSKRTSMGGKVSPDFLKDALTPPSEGGAIGGTWGGGPDAAAQEAARAAAREAERAALAARREAERQARADIAAQRQARPLTGTFGDPNKDADAAAREAKRAADEAEREAERIRKEQERAVREAERILEQERREAEKQADFEAQRILNLRDLGERRAQAIEDAADRAAEAISRANAREEEQIAEAVARFHREQDLAKDRKRLQDEINREMERFREGQAAARLGVTDSRADEDLGIRRGREDADLVARRAREAVSDREAARRAQDAVNAARFGGNSIQVLAAMAAKEAQQRARVDRSGEEDAQLALRRAREDEDVERARARRAADIESTKAQVEAARAELERLSAPMEAFNQKILTDNLAEQISAYARAKVDLVNAAEQLEIDTQFKADTAYDRGVARENIRGMTPTQIVHFYNYNSGYQGPDALQQMTTDMFEQNADALRVE